MEDNSPIKQAENRFVDSLYDTYNKMGLNEEQATALKTHFSCLNHTWFSSMACHKTPET